MMAIQTGTTRQISRLGADQAAQSPADDDANNGGDVRIAKFEH